MPRLPRIGCIVKQFPVVSQTFIATELIELERRGAEVLLLSLERSAGRCHRFIERAEFARTVVVGHRGFLPALRSFRPDLVHAHFATEPTEVARDLADALSVPFTFTAHGYDIYDSAPADFAERAAAATAVVTVSRENARQIVRRFSVPRPQIEVIPCGVNLRRIARIQSGKAKRPFPVIVCVARHHPVKNLEVLLDACARLRDRGSDFKAVLIGDGVMRSALEYRAERLGLTPYVLFEGALDHDDVLRWWKRASVAVLCSHREGLPVSLIEAGACGVPAVASGVGGVPELVRDGASGLLTEPGDPAALADAIHELLADCHRTAAMGHAARSVVRERFTVDRQIDSLLSVWAR